MQKDLSPVGAAQQKCWAHIVVANGLIQQLEALKELRAESIMPVLSETAPTLIITPEAPEDLAEIRTLCRYIRTALNVQSEWVHRDHNNEWSLQLVTPSNYHIDVLTHLPSTTKNPISL